MRSILFVDDHEVLARLSCEILSMQGYRADCAFNAADALAKLAEEDFDMLVTDFRMEGMNGLELAQKVREKTPHMPIIVITGYSDLDGNKDVTVLSKEDLFPGLLDKIKIFLGDAETDKSTESQALAG